MATAAPARQQGDKGGSPTSVAAAPGDRGVVADGKAGGDNGKTGRTQHVTPPVRRRVGRNPEMEADKAVVDELLLVCGVIGSTSTRTDPATGLEEEVFVPVTDCINWLQDLQRALRRDHETYRPVSLLLGQWRVVSQKLLPLVASCRYDRALVLTVCKILVILTKPLSEAARNAGRLTVNAKNGAKRDGGEALIQEQIVLRDNAIAQSDLLMEYKKLFVRHPSHHYAFQGGGAAGARKEPSDGGGDGGGRGGSGLLSIFTSLLAEPLSKTGSSRDSTDHLTVELVLHLIRNLLSIAPLSTFGSVERAQAADQLHRELLILLEEEMVLEVLVCVGQEVERRENSGYNLLILEILSSLLRGQDPTDVARSATVQSEPALSRPVELVPKRGGRKSAGAAPSKTRVVRTATTTRASAPAGGNSLRAHLASERRRIERSASSRHSHFGGTVMVEDGLGKKAYVSANDYLSRRLQSAGSGGGRHAASSLARPARRRNRKAEVFVGSGKSSSLHSRPGASAASSREVAGPASRRAKAALHGFCARFLEQCYGPVMKSLKNEFRRDSTRLEEGDRAIFFRIVWFFHQWWRAARGCDGKEKGDDGAKPDGKTVAGNLVFTMDVFMFNLVLNSTDEYHERRRPAPLAQTVALYAEMVQTLDAMYESPDGTERMMALGLMDRLFYASEPLDRLPRLFSRWTPGLHSREYLCDLVECSHATWRLLDTNDERCRPPSDGEGGAKRRPKDTVERFNMAASEFDRNGYFLRKFVSNQIVFMYTQLLSRYDVNSAEVNRHAVAYLVRLCKHEVRTGDVDDDEFDDGPGGNELATRRSTLEPMLYNIGMLSTLDKILNDTSIRDREEFASLLMFAASFMKRFARAAEANPMLYVEAMFKHPNPHRFCAVTSNMYVNEELRMMTVRDMLVEDQRKYEQNGGEDDFERAATGGEEEKEENARPKYDSDDEEEVEFDGDDLDEGVVGRNKKKRRKPSRGKRKSKSSAPSPLEDNNDDSEDEDNSVSGADRGNSGSADAGGATDEDKEGVVAAPRMPPDGPPEDEPSPRLSGKKRIRKSLALEDSDDDDAFFNNAPAQPKAKRAILDDSDDED